MPAKKHPHKYRRIQPKNDGSSATYRCVSTGCTHYLREEFIVGQMATCYRCDKVFEITKAILFPRKIVKIHCTDCNRPTYNRKTGKVETKKQILSTEEVTTLLDDILAGKVIE